MEREVAILNRVVRKVTEEMTLEQRIRGSEGVSQMGKKFPSRGLTLFPVYFHDDPLSPVPAFVTVPSNPEESTVGLAGSAQLYKEDTGSERLK